MRVKVSIEIPDEDIIALAGKLLNLIPQEQPESESSDPVRDEKTSHRSQVQALIQSAKGRGVIGKTIQEKTGLSGKQVSNIVFQLKKAGKIRKKAGKFFWQATE